MPIVPNIVNMVAGINQRKRQGRVRDAMSNYLTSPEEAIAQIYEDDPEYAQLLEQRRSQQRIQAEDRAAAQFERGLSYTRGIDDPSQAGQVVEALSPAFTNQGMTPQTLQNLRRAAQVPGIGTRRDEKAWEGMAKQYAPYTLQGGQQRFVGDQEVAAGRYRKQTIQVPTADGGVEVVLFDPNVGEFVTEDGQPAPPQLAARAKTQLEQDFDSEFVRSDNPTAQPGRTPLTVDSVRPHLVAQESGGDYTAVNSETGALGAYQVMPATGAALAKRLGMVWNPKMMTMDTPEARRYQDAIGGAAIQEAIDNSGGDPRTMAIYYHGGSNREIWGPRTQKYGDDMIARLGGGGGQQTQPRQAQPQMRVSRTRISSGGANRPGRYVDVPASQLPEGIVFAQRDTQTGELVNAQRAQTQRGGGETATELKDRREQEKQAEATERTSNLLGQMVGDYVRLSNMDDAIIDPRRGAGANIEAWMNSSSLGQFIGGMTGSEAQSVRQMINNIRPTLLNQVRQASEMGARGLDSDKELEFYLQAATDTGRDLLSNLGAIHILDIAYGRGDTLARNLPPDLYDAISGRAIQMANEQGSNYLFQNTGRQEAPAGEGGFRVIRRK